jgi:hypothetical protein
MRDAIMSTRKPGWPIGLLLAALTSVMGCHAAAVRGGAAQDLSPSATRFLAFCIGDLERPGPTKEPAPPDIVKEPENPKPSDPPPPPPPPPSQLASGLVGAHSILPAPDGRMYFATESAIFFYNEQTRVPQKLSPPSAEFEQMNIGFLLASTKDPKNLTFYVQARRSKEAPDEIWEVDVRGDAITAARPARLPAQQSELDRFFTTLHMPRCRPDGTRCLVRKYFNGQASLLIEPRRGTDREEYKNLGAVTVLDVAWGDNGYVWLLRSASPPDGAARPAG